MKFGNVGDWHTSVAKSANGVPLDLGEGRTLLVKRAGTRNRAFMAAVATIDVNDDAASRAVYARTVVAGWSGFNDEAGNPIPFSPEACIELFDYAPEIFDLMWLFAAQRANFRDAELAEEKAQVKKQSSGTKAQARTRRS
jgi:hypothetical protein